MKSKVKKAILQALLCLFVAAAMVACQKEGKNQPPTLVFEAPDNNLLIEDDTVIHIVVKPYDADGFIKKVELLIDGVVVITFEKAPYEYSWFDAKIENEGVHAIKAIAYDDKGATGQSEINLEIRDYRSKYLGNYNFTVVTIHWMLGQPNTYDTAFYNGLIRPYEQADSENDLYLEDDSNENPNEKISIEFAPGLMITSLLNRNGSLVSKAGYHYLHDGGFTNMDTIAFNVGGFGGLGAGWGHVVTGYKKYTSK